MKFAVRAITVPAEMILQVVTAVIRLIYSWIESRKSK
jgi:hypothetical protein